MDRGPVVSRPTALLLIALAVSLIAHAARAVPWVVPMPSPQLPGRSTELAIDSTGAPIALATLGEALVVTKRDATTGAELWRASFGGQSFIVGRAGALTVDASDDVIVVGSRQIPFGGERGLVAKLDGATGAVLWTWDSPYEQYYESFGYSALADVVVDANGDIVAVGARSISGGVGWELFVAKLDGSGNPIWLFDLDGTQGDESDDNTWPDRARRVVLDGSGNPIVLGTLRNQGNATDAVLVRLDAATGTPTWRHDFDSGAIDVALGLALLPNGDVAASLGGPNLGHVLRIAPGASQPAWVHAETTVYDLHSWIHDVAAAPNGDVFYGGVLDGGVVVSMVVGRLDGANGGVVWRQLVDDGTTSWEQATSLDVGAGGDLYVGGALALAGERRMSLARLDGPSGVPVWSTLFEGEKSSGNVAHDVLIDDAAGTVFGAGQLATSTATPEATLVALDADDGKAPIPLHEPDLFLIPLWDDWLLWLRPVEDVERAYEEALALRRKERGALLSRNAEALLRAPDREIEIFPRDGEEALQMIMELQRELSDRRADATLVVEIGSPAHALAMELGARAGKGDTRFGSAAR